MRCTSTPPWQRDLSRYPILKWENVDISAHASKPRLLHCELDVPAGSVAACSAASGVNESGRASRCCSSPNASARGAGRCPLIIAGDFTDWRRPLVVSWPATGLREVFDLATASLRGVFPPPCRCVAGPHLCARLQRRFADVLHGQHWRRLSDHAALIAQLQLL